MPALRIHLLGGKRAQCFGCSLPMADPLPGSWYIRCAMLRAQWGGIRWQKLARASPCLAQAPDAGTEGPARWCFPGLNLAPASSAIPEKRRQGSAAAAAARRPVGDSSPTGHAAAIERRQIGQPLSVCIRAATRGYAVVLMTDGIRWHRRPILCRQSFDVTLSTFGSTCAESQHFSRVVHRSHGVLRAHRW
ncbi:hypothetical protein TgHK011_006612 [Trichoderma gracile]|nr:hypothetical protein TgHK011_006612 [Trichoderma gracile]